VVSISSSSLIVSVKLRFKEISSSSTHRRVGTGKKKRKKTKPVDCLIGQIRQPTNAPDKIGSGSSLVLLDWRVSD
jgi:hypothetical protein